MESRFQQIAFLFLAMTALILVLINSQGAKVKIAGFVALAVLVVLTLVFPFAGMIVSVPVFLVAYIDNHKLIWSWWDKVKNKQ